MNASERAPDERSRDVRRAAFTSEFNRLLDTLRLERGWSTNRVALETRGAAGKSTIYRWKTGDWGTGSPDADTVAAVYNALGFDPAPALVALGVLRQVQPRTPEPESDPELDRHVAALRRQLRDPHVSDARKTIIRATLRELAGEPPTEARNRHSG